MTDFQTSCGYCSKYLYNFLHAGTKNAAKKLKKVFTECIEYIETGRETWSRQLSDKSVLSTFHIVDNH